MSTFKLRARPATSARQFGPSPTEFLQRYKDSGEAAVAEPFTGVTTDGTVVRGLYALEKTGVPTTPIRAAADAFLAALTAEQRARAVFPLETDAWRRWSNIHPFTMRHGVCLDDLGATPRERALDVVRACLSGRGFASARDVMKLNETILEITGRGDEYGEWLYWISVMGTPSDREPWGWQLDGHHLNLHGLIVGDQVVLTPMFFGSEPVFAESGAYAGTRVFHAEEHGGLELMRTLTREQRERAILARELPPEVFTVAFRDNFELAYTGVRFGDLSSAQQRSLLALVEVYTGRIRPGHAEIRLDEVKRHLADTWFAWMGGVDEDSVFYYRIHSPVILVEFDHQRGIAFDNDEPSRNHIHTVVRTPNGGDYGRDLLRQHHEQFDHSRAGTH